MNWVGEPLGSWNGIHRPPWLYIAVAPLEIAQALIRKGLWSTPNVIFFAIPFQPEILTYAFTMANLRFVADRKGGR